MLWGEALRLTQALASDPSSHLAASVSGWTRPATFVELALLNLYDLTHQVAWAQGGGKGPRPKALERPWQGETTRSRVKPTVSQEDVIRALRFAGHHGPIPGQV